MTPTTLPEQARIVAGMIALGEHIAFGRDTELLMQLADRVDALTKELKDNESDNASLHRQLDHWQVISIHWMNERNTLADQVEALTKERDKLKEAAKLANAFIEWTAYGNCRADEGPIPTASEVSTALRRAGVQ